MEKNSKHSYISNNLKLALSKKFNMPISEINIDFMKTLKEIDLHGYNIKDIKGIEFAINATYINLARNNIHNASYLGKLKNLVHLDLNENKIEDIGFIKKMKNLKSVGLESNNIKNLPKLTNPNLTMLNLDNNNISDLTNLSELNLNNLNLLVSDQCIVLDPLEVDIGKSVFFKSNIHWNKDILVPLDNIQVSGKYDAIHTDERPSILYSISEVIIRNIQSNCLLKVDFYYENSTDVSQILSGTIIQPIYLNRNSIYSSNENIDIETSQIQGILKYADEKLNTKHIKSHFSNKTITLINEYGEKIYSLTNDLGEYTFNKINKGKYTLLFPVLSEHIYTTDSIYVLNIKTKGKYIINALTEVIS